MARRRLSKAEERADNQREPNDSRAAAHRAVMRADQRMYLEEKDNDPSRSATAVPAEILDAPPDFAAEGQEVTMRGDLEQISLSDIIQTLSMSKMEGILG